MARGQEVLRDEKKNLVYLAFLFGNSRAFPLIHHGTLLFWNILADFILDSVALPVVDDLALCHGVGGALLLGHGLALPFIPGGAGLGSLRGTGFFMESFLDGSGDVDTLQFLRVVALLLLHSGTLLADIIGSGTVPLDLERTFSSLDLLLHRPLGNLAGSLLDIGTGLVRDVSALLLGHRLVGCLGNLVTDFLGHLATHRLRSWSSFGLNNVGVELMRDITEGKDTEETNVTLHDAEAEDALIFYLQNYYIYKLPILSEPII